MSVSTLDRAQIARIIRAFLDSRRPPQELRKKLDYGFRYHRQSIELFSIRPKWGGQTGKTESAFAKATFVKTTGVWKVYWMRGNLKWHPYEPATVRSLKGFLKLVNEDKHGCFFG